MNERIARLRAESLAAVVSLSPERARLVTAFHRSAPEMPFPLLRAGAFRDLLERQTLWIGDGELIVGERGPRPKATPSFPEICCHTLEDLDQLNTREKIPYHVDSETRSIYEEEIIPYWKGRTQREQIFEKMSDAWLASYQAGIFTEFMEQRAPGHTVLDEKIYHKGLLDLIDEIDRTRSGLGSDPVPEIDRKRHELDAMEICARAMIRFAERHAERAEQLVCQESDRQRRSELQTIAAICRHVPAFPPRTFHEALQSYWFVHIGVIAELNPWDAMNPGRLDQHLLPFYQSDLAEGRLTEDGARELLECFWIKFNNQPAPPKVGVTAAESSTYTDFANINTGGLTSSGEDGVNELSYLILDVIDEMRLLQPSSNIQLSRRNPDRFLDRACRIIRKGWGQPSVFNADVVVEELVRQGKRLEDARNGGTSGCVEAGAFGKESYVLTGYMNLPKILEIALHNGVDPVTGIRIGLETGPPETFPDFDAFLEAFRHQLRHFVDLKIAGNDIIERLYADRLPVPFLSILIDDCIARGTDYNGGGARYNTTYVQGVGLGTLTDSLSAIHHHLFRLGTVSFPELLQAIDDDFVGHEKTRQMLSNRTPRYGNDDERADSILQELFEIYYDTIDGRPNQKGGVYRINLLPTTCHIYFGAKTGATPDGRKRGQPLSEGISPVQSADRKGPTAVLRSAAKIDHRRTGGTLLNQKFTPSVLEGEKGIETLRHLVRAYFRLGGHHIQFNVVDATTLRAAQNEPEHYRDLIVRVAGYSDYFCDLHRALQDEIIARTEHGAS